MDHPWPTRNQKTGPSRGCNAHGSTVYTFPIDLFSMLAFAKTSSKSLASKQCPECEPVLILTTDNSEWWWLRKRVPVLSGIACACDADAAVTWYTRGGNNRLLTDRNLTGCELSQLCAVDLVLGFLHCLSHYYFLAVLLILICSLFHSTFCFFFDNVL
jgi:hypothetical protein